MEDRYLFKAKTNNGKWIEWNILTGIPHDINIINSTICQCTGLKDKNVKLIWENDVIAYWDTYSTESGLAEADCTGQVVWDDETMSFQVTNRLSAESYEVLDECSVIGNIFDNKELLESEETVWQPLPEYRKEQEDEQ